MQDITGITNEKDGDIIFVTVAKYKLFMSNGKVGMDAYCLYSHMMFTARLQETNQIYANDTYLKNGLSWSKERIQKAKQLLIELKLIEEFYRRDNEGKFIGKYIKVVTKTTPFEINEPLDDLPSAGKTASGELETNALTNNINALTKKENASRKKDKDKKDRSPSTNNFLSSFNIFWSMYDKKVNMKKCLDIWKKINPNLYDTIYKHTKAYVSSTPDKSWRKDPERYLKHECWNNEIIRKKEQGIEYPEL